MSNCLHQSEPAETSMQQQEFSPLEIIGKSAELTQGSINCQSEFKKFIKSILQMEGQQFQNSLKKLNIFFEKGYTKQMTVQPEVQKKMMNYFCRLSKQVQTDAKAESKMLFILSLIAEMIKQSPNYYFPFTRKFMLKVFQIDNQSLENSPQKNQILAILGVIFNNLSIQGKLINKLHVEKELKNALLTNYYLINQLFTLKLFNRSVLNMSSKGVSFTSGEFHKYDIMQTISKFIAQNQVEMFLARMKASLFQVKPKIHNQKNLVI